MKRMFLVILTTICLALAGCNYRMERSIETLTICDLQKKSYRVGKSYSYHYWVYFTIDNDESVRIDSHTLYDTAKIGDKITLYKIETYNENDELINVEYELIY